MSASFRLIHLSDPHLTVDVPFSIRLLTNKRIVGWLNLQFNRSKLHSNDVAFRAVEAIRSLTPDHVVVTGDLSNLALDQEFALARTWLDGLDLPPKQVTVVPGNHDAYVSDTWRRASLLKAIRPYMQSDEEQDGSFPIVRTRGFVTLVGLSSAVPSPPLMAWGKLGRKQLDHVEQVLERTKGQFRVLSCHHPVQIGAGRWDNRLIDAESLRRILARKGAELVLHGHLHRAMQGAVSGPMAGISVLGVGSASLAAGEGASKAQFRVIDVEHDGAWRQVLHVYDRGRRAFVPRG
ncbi:MAG: metallophosphoesterase [Deltaproteobacteria bacterium]|nr:metallophosphoesterase [Deltaproteobacteria bacterium]